MNVGILGAGTIVPDFLQSSRKVEGIEPYAIFGTSKPEEVAVMKHLSSTYGIKKLYFDYDEMLNDENIDCIYVALPNSLHYAFAKKALECKKSVIVEKPFTSNALEAEELIRIAQAKELFIFEAIPNIYFPNFKEIKNLLKTIGDVKVVQLNLSKFSRRYDGFKLGNIHPSFDPKKAGGALMDLNIYNIHFLVNTFGIPTESLYHANIEHAIDTSGFLTVKYPSFKGIAIAAKDSSSPSGFCIQGDKGLISSTSAPHILNSVCVEYRDGKKENFNLNDTDLHARLQYELSEFYDIWMHKDFDKRDRQLELTLAVSKLLDISRKQAGILV